MSGGGWDARPDNRSGPRGGGYRDNPGVSGSRQAGPRGPSSGGSGNSGGLSGRDPRSSRDTRDPRSPRSPRDPRDRSDYRGGRDDGYGRDGRSSRDPRDSRDPRSGRDSRNRSDYRGSRDERDSRDGQSDRSSHRRDYDERRDRPGRSERDYDRGAGRDPGRSSSRRDLDRDDWRGGGGAPGRSGERPRAPTRSRHDDWPDDARGRPRTLDRPPADWSAPGRAAPRGTRPAGREDAWAPARTRDPRDPRTRGAGGMRDARLNGGLNGRAGRGGVVDEKPAASRGKMVGIAFAVIFGALVLGGGTGGMYWYLSAPKPASAASGTPAPTNASPATFPVASPAVSPTATH